MVRRIDGETVRRVARLSRLELSVAEVSRMSRELSVILDYFGQLSQVDTEDVVAMDHGVPVSNVFREDEVEDSLALDDALLNAPRRQGDYFRVPKIVDPRGGV